LQQQVQAFTARGDGSQEQTSMFDMWEINSQSTEVLLGRVHGETRNSDRVQAQASGHSMQLVSSGVQAIKSLDGVLFDAMQERPPFRANFRFSESELPNRRNAYRQHAEVQKENISDYARQESMSGMWGNGEITRSPYRREQEERFADESGGTVQQLSYIVSQNSEYGAQEVFDLQVEDDSSFCVGGVFAHNCALIDDGIKNREEADSQRIRDNVWAWYTSTFYTRLMPNAAIIIMNTRWHEDDLAARVQNSAEHWDVVKLPAIANEGTDNEIALWPEWYPLPELRRIRDVIPPRDWHALYQQEPRAESGTYIQRDWFQDRGTKSEAFNIYGYSDYAVTEAGEGKDPDSTEHGVFGLGNDGKIYVLDWWHGQTTSDVWIERQIAMMLKHKPLCWFGEGGTIRRAVEPFLTKRMVESKCWTRVEWINPINNKEIRGRSFQGMASMGRIIFPENDWAERIINQCVSFPGGKHDDAFDVMSGICLAFDEAHPAIYRPKETQDDDKWRKSMRKQRGDDSWKVA
jgi:predicted phage terminase large subunit-like protein